MWAGLMPAAVSYMAALITLVQRHRIPLHGVSATIPIDLGHPSKAH